MKGRVLAVVRRHGRVLGKAEFLALVKVVRDVVAGVGLGRAVEGGQPHGVHAQAGQIGQPGGNARQVADAIAVGVGERARINLVDHGAAPPFRAGWAWHGGGWLGGWGHVLNLMGARRL